MNNNNNVYTFSKLFKTVRRHTVSGRQDRSNSDGSQKSCKVRSANIGKDNIQRPFYRDDIFYGGSLHRLPHYKSQVPINSIECEFLLVSKLMSLIQKYSAS